MASILDLPEEILQMIFGRLSSLDLINVSQVCVRLFNICCRKGVVGSLDYSGTSCYSLDSNSLKNFLKPKVIYQHVHTLNLNYCHWLPSTFFHYLKKIKSLKGLHLIDCRVTLETIADLIFDKELSSLSLSLGGYGLSKIGSTLVKCKTCLSRLKTFHCEIWKIEDVYCLCTFLGPCLKLEKLVVSTIRSFKDEMSFVASGVNIVHYRKPVLPNIKFVQFPMTGRHFTNLENDLRSIIVPDVQSHPRKLKDVFVLQGVDAILDMPSGSNALLTECVPLFDKFRHIGLPRSFEFDLSMLRRGDPLMWRTLFLDSCELYLHDINAVAELCPNLRTISMQSCLFYGPAEEIFPGLKRIAQNCKKVTRWEFTHTHSFLCKDDPLLAIANAKNLTHLSFPVEWLLESELEERAANVEPNSFKLKRIGRRVSFLLDSMKQTRLWPLTEGCPKMLDLKIAKHPANEASRQLDCESSVRNTLDETLATISRFQNLQRLSIFNVTNIRSGDFLGVIMKACEQLSYLCLVNVGPRGQCCYISGLSQNLLHAKALKELRLHHPRINLTSNLCRFLATCPKLEQLVLSSVSIEDKYICSQVFRTVELLSTLMVLCIWTIDMPSKVMVKDFRSSASRIRKDRPLFHLVFENVGGKIKDHRDSLYTHPSNETPDSNFCNCAYVMKPDDAHH